MAPPGEGQLDLPLLKTKSSFLKASHFDFSPNVISQQHIHHHSFIKRYVSCVRPIHLCLTWHFLPRLTAPNVQNVCCCSTRPWTASIFPSYDTIPLSILFSSLSRLVLLNMLCRNYRSSHRKRNLGFWLSPGGATSCLSSLFEHSRPTGLITNTPKRAWSTSLRPIFGRPFVKRFAVCYRTVVLSVLSVCDVGVLWPNGWTDEDETWHARRPRLWPHCVRWGSSSPTQKGHSPPIFGPCPLRPK